MPFIFQSWSQAAVNPVGVAMRRCQWLLAGLLLMVIASGLQAAPTVTLVSPTRNVLAPGQSLNLSVTASGTGTVSYQWTRKGKTIPGATGSSFSVPSVTYADSGWYLVDATDSAGTTRSKPIFVIVAPAKTKTRYWDGNGYYANQYSDFDDLDDIISVAPGETHSLAMRRGGSLVLHGHSGSPSYPQLPESGDYVEVGVGQYSSLGLRSNGTIVEAFASYRMGSPTMNGLSDVVAIASGLLHALALKSDGTVVAWGYNEEGQCNVPAGLTGVKAIACTAYNSYALKSDGTLVIWGSSYGGMTSQNGLGGVAAIACAVPHFVAIKTDGAVVAFGVNGAGQCNVPAGLTGVMAVAAGSRSSTGSETGYSLALKQDGTAVEWGYGGGPLPSLTNIIALFAQYGLPIIIQDATADTVPIVTGQPLSQAALETQPLTLSVSVTGAQPMTYQWRKNGTNILNATAATLSLSSVSAFDAGDYDVVITNYLGSTTSAAGTLSVTELPAISASDPVYRMITPGASTTLVPGYAGPGALSYQWFRNGQMLAGATGSSLTLASAAYSDNGYYFADIVDANGVQRSPPIFVTVAPAKTQIRAWGQGASAPALDNIVSIVANAGSGLGLKRNGVVTQLGSEGLPLPVGLSGVVAVAASQKHALALRKDGTVAAWGDNYYGQTTVPVGLSQVVAVAAGSEHSLALRSDGTVVAWGSNAWSQCTIPAGLSHVVAISAGYHESYAVKDNGTVVAWGNTYSESADLAALSNVASLAKYSQGYHLLALRRDGTVAAVGTNYEGQSSVPASLAGVTMTAAGLFHSLAVKNDGTVVCWGSNAQGQVSPPANLNNVFSVAAGITMSFAIRDATSDAPPTVVVQPYSMVRTETAKAAFTVAATGPGPYAYQWRKNGVPLAGATTASLQLTDLAIADAGDYDVVITNYVGSTTSATATLTVLAIPVVTSMSPSRQVIASGQNVNLSVTATGTGVLSYQWTHDGRPITGATNATLTLTNFTRSSAGCYLVLITDSIGTRISQPIFLFFAPGTGPAPVTQLRAWGTPSLGLHDIPAGLSDVVDLACLSYNPLALRANGTVVTWGVNASYFPVPAGLTGAVGLAVCDGHRAVVKSDGTVVAWGDNSYKQCDVPAGLGDVVSVACGGGYTLALKADGTVVGWGGQHTNQSPYYPVYVQNVPVGLKNVVAVLALANMAVALRTDGTIVSWSGAPWDPAMRTYEEYSEIAAITGSSRFGLLKRDGTVQVVPNNYWDNVPYVPLGLSSVAALQGTESLFAVKTDGTVVAWRLSAAVELPEGIPDVIKITDMTNGGLVLRDASTDAPPVLSLLADKTLAEGVSTSWTIAATGPGPFAYQWRKNGVDIAGATTATLTLPNILPATAGSYDVVVTNYKGATTSNAAVLSVQPLPHVVTVGPVRQTFVPGENLTLAVSATGTGTMAYQWYCNGRAIPGATTNQLSRGNLALPDSGAYFVRVTDDNGIRASDPMFVIVAPTKTKVVGWGFTNYNSTAVTSTGEDIVAISAGTGDHSLALRRNGSVLRFGSTYAGETEFVAGLTDMVAVDAGGSLSLALRSNGTVVAWGSNSSGETNVPTGLSGVIAISAGGSHALALTTGGKVVAWGNNVYGQSTVPADLADVVAIAAGPDQSVAVRADGSVVAWGSAASGKLNVPAGLVGVVAVATGAGQTLALRGDGTVSGWGNLGWGEGTVPQGSNSGALGVVAGFQHSYLLKRDGTLYGWGSNVGYMIDTPAGLSGVYALSGKDSFTLALVGQSAPAIFFHPESITRREQQTIELSVGATGLAPLNYQWRKNGTPIVGATSASLIVEDTSLGDMGSYDVVITNPLGSVTSHAADVALIPVPVVTSQTGSRNVGELGGAITFSVTATGSGDLSYQWLHDGMPVAGATASNLTLSGLTAADNGSYTINITDANGTRRSRAMFLTVAPPFTKVRVWGASAWGQTAVPVGLSDVIAISAGSSQVLALRRNGTVVAWGGAGLNTINPPPDLTDVVAIAAGYADCLALKSDGTVVSWNLYGESFLTVPPGLKNVVAIATDGHHSMALKSNGKVVVWGDNLNFPLAAPVRLSNIVAIAAGQTFSLALDNDGVLYAWGSPVTVGNGAVPPVRAVDASDSRILAQRPDGTLVSVGVQYGPGMAVPVDLGSVRAFAAGTNHMLAIKHDGSVVAWGAGNLDGADVVPNDLTGAFAIAAGLNFSVALAKAIPPVITTQPVPQSSFSGDTVHLSVSVSNAGPLTYQWRRNGVNLSDGGNISGASGPTLSITGVMSGDAGSYDVVISNSDTSIVSDIVALNVTVLSFSKFSAGRYHSLRLDGLSRLYVTGTNTSGQLGTGNTTTINTAQQVILAGQTIVDMAAGGEHSLFLTSAKEVWATGLNSTGQLGDGTTVNKVTPVKVATGVVGLAANRFHSAFLKSDGTLWTVGGNDSGQLGNGTTTDSTIATQVASGVVDVAAGIRQTLFIKSDGTLWGAGDLYNNGTLTSTPIQIASNVKSVAAGAYHSLFVKNDGTLWSLGFNAYGQLGTGNATTATTPVQIATGVRSVAAGDFFSLFLKTDNTLWATGYNNFGQLGDGTTNNHSTAFQMASGVVAISASESYTLFTKTDGSLWATGLNDNGQFGNGNTTSVSSPIQVSPGTGLAPGAATGLTATTPGTNDRVHLSWVPTVNAASYEVWRSTTNDSGTATRIAREVRWSLYEDYTATTLGTTYYYWIKAVNPSATGPYSNVTLYGTSIAPVFTQQPTAVTVTNGGNATFTVTVGGDPAPVLHWQRLSAAGGAWMDLSNGNGYSGVTTATLTISCTLVMSGDQLRCLATNAFGSPTSNAATLTVTPLPGDFNGDGVADPGWASPATGQRSVWFMTGTTPSGGVDLGAVEPAVQIATAGDFDGDGKPDFVVQNKVTGERSLWLMDGTSRGGTVSLTTQVLDWQIVFTGDFNADGKTDLVWQNLDTGQAVVWFMNGTTRLSIVDLGIVDPGLQVVGAGDFNADGKPDFLVQHRRTGQRTIWLMNGLTVTGTISLGTQTLDWELGPAADFNGDGKPDLIWQNTQTGLRMVWLMNGGSMTSALSLGVFPPTWRIVGATDLNHDGQVDLVWQDKSVPPVDFNADGHADLLWQNTQTGAFSLWYMNNLASVGSVGLGTQALAWQIVGAADFNGDGKGDILWQNNQTGLGEIWLMNGVNLSDVISLGTQELVWKIGGAADFNGDGQVDLLWQNTRTGQRSLWYMNGPNLGSAVDLGFQTLDWQICGAGDFNGDGQAEIIWQNTQTGQRTLWFMNGRQLGSAVDLGILSTAWQIVGAADMDGDGQADILMQNTQTGLRRVWIMDGFHINTAVDLTTQPVSWQIAN